jgi:soluble lytic murein transglycosylase-like protein
MTLFIMLAVGVTFGRLWAYCKTSSRLVDCPTCALEAAEQQARLEINALYYQAEARMAQVAHAEPRNGAASWHATPRQ